MKKIFAFAALLVFCLSLAGCSAQQSAATESGVEDDMDLDLIVYRNVPDDDNEFNIERLTITYSWVGGYVESILMQYDCATEEDAQAAYDSLKESYSDTLKIDGKRVIYNEDPAVWKYSKYDEVRSYYLSLYWSIIDDDKYIMAMSSESETSETVSQDSETTEATDASEQTEATEAVSEAA